MTTLICWGSRIDRASEDRNIWRKKIDEAKVQVARQVFKLKTAQKLCSESNWRFLYSHQYKQLARFCWSAFLFAYVNSLIKNFTEKKCRYAIEFSNTFRGFNANENSLYILRRSNSSVRVHPEKSWQYSNYVTQCHVVHKIFFWLSRR